MTKIPGEMLPIALAFASLSVVAQEATFLEEVIVTARKRAEVQQNVPVSITAVNAEDMVKRGIVNFMDVDIGNPNVAIASGTSNGAIAQTVAIRGNLQNDIATQLDPAVGVYLDGMILSRSYGISTSMIDLQSVQTLKGPQGTLFGRNTTGGAILLTTVAPSVEDGVTGYIKGEAGELGTLSYGGAVNIPLGDNVAVRLAARHREMDDFLEYNEGTELGESESDSFRAKLQWDLSENASLTFSAEHGEIDATYASQPAVQPNNPRFDGIDNIGGVFPTPPIPPISSGNPIITPAVAVPQDQNVESDLYILNLTHDTGWGEVKFITGYRELDSEAEITLPPGLGYTQGATPGLENFTAELQINGTFLDDRLDITSGLYYFDEKTTEDSLTFPYDEIIAEITVFPTVLIESHLDTDIESVSAYVQGTYAVTDAFNLTLGGRYTSDEREGDGTHSSATMNPLTYDYDEDEFNYLVSVDYQFSDDVMAYASTATGYRSGGANIGEDAANPSQWGRFEPENVTNYEVGLKSDWMDGRLRFNGALFYQDYEDYQFTGIVLVGGVPTRGVLSTDATILGGELDITAVLPAEFIAQFTYGYTEGEIDGGINDGASLSHIPETTYSVRLSKSFGIGDGDIDLTAIYDYRDSVPGSLEAEEATIDDRSLLNLSATYTNGSWTIAAYVNNATDEEYYQRIVYSPPSAAAFGLFGLSFSGIGQPRVAGLRLGYDF